MYYKICTLYNKGIAYLLLLKHNIGPHRILESSLNIGARMQEIIMLENENAAHFGIDVVVLSHIPTMESGRSTFEWFRFGGFVKVKVDSVVRSFRAIGGFVYSIAVFYGRILENRTRRERSISHTFKIFSLGVLQKSHPLIQPRSNPNLLPLY
jgi:hypothetical protein